MELEVIKKQCKLTLMELALVNQMAQNKTQYPSGRTIKEMRLPVKKIDALVGAGVLKKRGFCYEGTSNVRHDLYHITL